MPPPHKGKTVFYTSRRRSTLQSQSVSFEWWFEDESGEEITVAIEATCHPGEEQRITADPYDSHDGSDAYAEISATGITRELTAEEEALFMEGGTLHQAAIEQAFEKANGEYESAQDVYDDMKMQEWKESRNRPAAIFEKETEYAY